jgi:hypothetical protein
MGLGLFIMMKLPAKKGGAKGKKNNELFRIIASEMKLCLPALLQSNVFGAQTDGTVLSLQMHPAEEPVEFSVEAGKLLCSAKTSSAGPGYHAFLVESLERTADKLGEKWNWGGDDEDYGDETGYYEHRDFKRLQDEMCTWLKTLSENMLGDSALHNLSLSMPLGYSVVGDYFAMSPMGFRNKDWFKSVMTDDADSLLRKCMGYFPWWEKDFTAEFYFKCALCAAWVDLPWHTALDDAEVKKYTFVLDCFKKAKELDQSLQIPENEIKDIRLYCDKNSDAPAPNAEGIGFKKHLMLRDLTGGWNAEIPGYFYHEMEDDDTTAVYWFGAKTVRGSSLSVEEKNGRHVSREELLSDKPDDMPVIEFSKDHFSGWAAIEKVDDENGQYWCMSGRMATVDNLCFVTICYDKDEDKDWAIALWQSLMYPEEESE